VTVCSEPCRFALIVVVVGWVVSVIVFTARSCVGADHARHLCSDRFTPTQSAILIVSCLLGYNFTLLEFSNR
jgi:hypothetical protein